eukprot:GHRR01033926.1.p1 GENE.GHRR01033926.1~~GHRR01033926.1.p1  ORF type:complete len:153 (+),score=69.97 GHRR01033926.1:553-1011(+)
MSEARGEGGGGFLDRLGNDLKRRQAKMKELERRYEPGAAGDEAAAAAKSTAADLNLVASFLGQRGWAAIKVPSPGEAQQDLDEQLNEVADSYCQELSLTDGQRIALLAARGAKKVALLAAAVRTQLFMARCAVNCSESNTSRDCLDAGFQCW